MVDILTAKLQQHPELVEGITQRGGIAYLNASTHNVTGDVFWESTGQNKFLEALKEAYTNAINQNNNSNVSSDDSELLINSTDNDNAEALEQTYSLKDLMIEDDALVKESKKPTE